jgi:hypothetical protein
VLCRRSVRKSKGNLKEILRKSKGNPKTTTRKSKGNPKEILRKLVLLGGGWGCPRQPTTI